MPLLTVSQAAERLAVSVALVYAWCHDGFLPHVRLGRTGKRGTIRIAEADIDRLATATRVGPPPPPPPPAPRKAKPKRGGFKHLTL